MHTNHTPPARSRRNAATDLAAPRAQTVHKDTSYCSTTARTTSARERIGRRMEMARMKETAVRRSEHVEGQGGRAREADTALTLMHLKTSANRHTRTSCGVPHPVLAVGALVDTLLGGREEKARGTRQARTRRVARRARIVAPCVLGIGGLCVIVRLHDYWGRAHSR